MSTTSHCIFKVFGKIWIIVIFWEKNEKNSYQIQNILKKFEFFTIDVYYSA